LSARRSRASWMLARRQLAVELARLSARIKVRTLYHLKMMQATFAGKDVEHELSLLSGQPPGGALPDGMRESQVMLTVCSDLRVMLCYVMVPLLPPVNV
jgi:hypothetical protein